MPVEHGSRPRPVGLPNFSSDRGGGSSGKLPGSDIALPHQLKERPIGLPNFQQFGERSGDEIGWQKIARTYRVEQTAQNFFSIPERSWNHPTVRSLVESYLDEEDLQKSLYTAQNSPGIHVRAEGMNPRLAQRYSRVDFLMRGVGGILEYGFHPDDGRFSDYLLNKVGDVTKPFGVIVTHLSKEATQIPSVQTPAVMPGSAWADHVQREHYNLYSIYALRYGSENVKLWDNNQPREKNPQEGLVHFHEIASRLGIPEQNLEHPAIQEFITNLNDVEHLLKTFEQGEVSPGAAGLTPSVTERYTMNVHLMHIAIAIMEEGFQGRTVEPQFIANHVNSALGYFGLQARVQIK